MARKRYKKPACCQWTMELAKPLVLSIDTDSSKEEVDPEEGAAAKRGAWIDTLDEEGQAETGSPNRFHLIWDDGCM